MIWCSKPLQTGSLKEYKLIVNGDKLPLREDYNFNSCLFSAVKSLKHNK